MILSSSLLNLLTHKYSGNRFFAHHSLHQFPVIALHFKTVSAVKEKNADRLIAMINIDQAPIALLLPKKKIFQPEMA